MLRSRDQERIIELYKKLKQFERYKKDNRLDLINWSEYPDQNDIFQSIINRLETKQGPSIYPVFGSNRSGKSELGGGIIAEIFKRFHNWRIWCATWADLSIKVQQRKLATMIRKRDIKYGTYTPVRGWANRTIISKLNTVSYVKTYDQGASAFQGDDIDFCWLDEECPWDIYSEVLIRLADRQGVLLITFTSLRKNI